ncbi:type IV secretion system protein [Anaerovibrio sp.]|uniref:type IV secretion system protein n=1 Tax=Anaerovibrio sp. TaxID=1872532 RepID=UPI0038902D1B
MVSRILSINKYRLLILTLLVLCICSVAFAADNTIVGNTFSIKDVKSYTGNGTGINSDFDDVLMAITGGIITIAKPIVVILTALSGALIAFGWDNVSKTMWSTIFGLCIALNIGYFIFEPSTFGILSSNTGTYDSGVVNDMASVIQLGESAASDFNFLSRFMTRYLKLVTYSASIIVPYLDKLLLILLLIDTMLESSLNLNEGNKFRFLIDMCLKGGFFLFLIHNWLSADTLGISLTGALSKGFEQLGFIMGQGTQTDLVPDSIVENAGTMFTALYEGMKNSFSLTSPNTWCMLLATPIILFTVIMTSIEIFMVRIEYYTVALLTMPLLPFGVCKYTKFLSEKTFGVMFNIAIKLMAMAFIQSFSLPYMQALAKDMEGRVGELNNLPSLVLEFVLACVVIWYLTKNVKGIINTLLTGSPSLDGGGMTATAIKAGAMAGAAAGTIASGGTAAGGMAAVAKSAVQGAQAAGGNMSSGMGMAKGAAGLIGGAASGGASLVMSTLGNVAKAGMNKAIGGNPIAQGFQSGVTAMLGDGKSGGLLRGPMAGKVSDTMKNYRQHGGADARADNIAARAANVGGGAVNGAIKGYEAAKFAKKEAVSNTVDAAKSAAKTAADAPSRVSEHYGNKLQDKFDPQKPGNIYDDAVMKYGKMSEQAPKASKSSFDDKDV